MIFCKSSFILSMACISLLGGLRHGAEWHFNAGCGEEKKPLVENICFAALHCLPKAFALHILNCTVHWEKTSERENNFSSLDYV